MTKMQIKIWYSKEKTRRKAEKAYISFVSLDFVKPVNVIKKISLSIVNRTFKHTTLKKAIFFCIEIETKAIIYSY